MKILILLVGLLAIFQGVCSTQARRRTLSRNRSAGDQSGEPHSLSIGCGYNKVPSNPRGTANRVAGGRPIHPGEFPSFVVIAIERANYSAYCGGTIYSPRHVITASHCFDNSDMSAISVTPIHMDSTNDDLDTRAVKVKKICSDPRTQASRRQSHYRQGPMSGTTDLAVLELATALEFNGVVGPVCMNAENFEGRPEVAVGIGLTDDANTGDTGVKRMLKIPVTECGSHDGLSCYKAFQPDWMGQVCNGDSGGPIYAWDNTGRQHLAAVVIAGPVGCTDRTSVETFAVELSENLDTMNILLRQCGA